MADIDITDMTGGDATGTGGDATDTSTPPQGVDVDIGEWDVSDGGEGGTPGEALPFSPPVGWGDEVTRIVETSTAEWITDYSAERLALYEQTGAVAWAIYDDDAEAQVEWSSVSDPTPPPTTAVNEAYEIATATNQHFWHDSNGAHVSTDASNQYGTRNILLNAYGMLFRRLRNYMVSITESAISFWDGLGNLPENILAYFGKDGARIGRANEANSTISPTSFTIRNGLDDAFKVKIDYEMLETSPDWPRRKVYKVYKAGYGGAIDSDIAPEGRVTAPIEDPSAQLYIGDTWYSDGRQAGYTGMLMSVEEFAENAWKYSSYGSDALDHLSEYYRREVNDYVPSNPRDVSSRTTAFWLTSAALSYGVPVWAGFSDEVLAQIPQDVWTDEALAAGAPNWFIGSVYDVPHASLELNGYYWDGRIYTADEEKASTDKNITIDNVTQEVNANMLTASQVSNLLTDD